MRPHERVADALRARIRTGVWQDGQMIPGRRKLAEEHGVALTTVERAVSSLIAEGALRADDRRGTFVTSSPQADADGLRAPPGTQATVPLTATVGLVAEVLNYPSQEMRAIQWTARMLAACEHRLSAEAGVSQTFINQTPGDGNRVSLEDALLQLQAEGASAAVVIGMGDTKQNENLVKRMPFPVVVIAYEPMTTMVSHVCIDNTAGGVLAARHLSARGYQPLVYIRPVSVPWIESRLAGARAEAGQQAITVWPEKALPETTMFGGGGQRDLSRMVSRELLAKGIVPGTGVIAPNDQMAVGFQLAAAEFGLVAGRDFGLVGFDDWERELQITSLRPPMEQLGEEAARMIVALLRGNVCPTRVTLPPRLIARTSTRAGEGVEGDTKPFG